MPLAPPEVMAANSGGRAPPSRGIARRRADPSRHQLALRLTCVAGCTLLPRAVYAHVGKPPEPHDLWTAWSLEPVTLVALAFSAWGYTRGARTLWRRAGRGRSVAVWRAWCYAGGMAAVFLALVSPIDAVGSALFAAHMVQHLLLTTVAPPLLLLGEPLLVTLWAFPARTRRAIGGWWRRSRIVRPLWRAVARPAVAVGLHLTAIALWHVPRPYDAALREPALHVAEHLSFFGSALLFWWLVCDRGARRRLGAPLAVVALFVVAMQGTVLGALLTVARQPWYTSHLATTGAWGLTPLEDQQLAGLVMWVPAGLVYLVAAAVLTAGALAGGASIRGAGVARAGAAATPVESRVPPRDQTPDVAT